MVKGRINRKSNNQRICSRCGITFNGSIDVCPICDKQLNIHRKYPDRSLKKIITISKQFDLKQNKIVD